MGAVALAGCSSQQTGGDDDSGSGGSSSGGSEDTGPVTEDFITDTSTVEEDGWVYYDWTQDMTVEYTIEYIVRDGPEIDVYVMSEDEFENYDNGDRFRTYLDSTGTSGTMSGTLAEGSYYLVLDNSEKGAAQPPTNFDEDPARVEIESTQTY